MGYKPALAETEALLEHNPRHLVGESSFCFSQEREGTVALCTNTLRCPPIIYRRVADPTPPI